MTEISINKSEYEISYQNLISNVNAIKLDGLSDEISGNSDALNQFGTLYSEFISILSLYRNLLNADLSVINSAADKIKLDDELMTNLFKIG